MLTLSQFGKAPYIKTRNPILGEAATEAEQNTVASLLLRHERADQTIKAARNGLVLLMQQQGYLDQTAIDAFNAGQSTVVQAQQDLLEGDIGLLNAPELSNQAPQYVKPITVLADEAGFAGTSRLIPAKRINLNGVEFYDLVPARRINLTAGFGFVVAAIVIAGCVIALLAAVNYFILRPLTRASILTAEANAKNADVWAATSKAYVEAYNKALSACLGSQANLTSAQVSACAEAAAKAGKKFSENLPDQPDPITGGSTFGAWITTFVVVGAIAVGGIYLYKRWDKNKKLARQQSQQPQQKGWKLPDKLDTRQPFPTSTESYLKS